MPRNSERGGSQTRARISLVATRLFVADGFDAITVADVAREAGVSTVTVFNHFRRKEDLLFDRTDDALELLRHAVRDRVADTDVVTSLRDAAYQLVESRHPLSGLDERSLPFFRTVAASPGLVARAREIAAELQGALAGELTDDPRFTGDAGLVAALFVGGYADVLTQTARRLLAGTSRRTVTGNHRIRLERLFDGLRAAAGSQ